MDGRLIVRALKCREQLDTRRRLIIITDGERLKRTHAELGEEKKRGFSVVKPAVLASAMLLIPGATVNLDCVRRFLFERALPNTALNLDSVVQRTSLTRRAGTLAKLDSALLDEQI